MSFEPATATSVLAHEQETVSTMNAFAMSFEPRRCGTGNQEPSKLNAFAMSFKPSGEEEETTGGAMTTMLLNPFAMSFKPSEETPGTKTTSFNPFAMNFEPSVKLQNRGKSPSFFLSGSASPVSTRFEEDGSSQSLAS